MDEQIEESISQEIVLVENQNRKEREVSKMRKLLKMSAGSVLLFVTVLVCASSAAEGVVTYEKDVQKIFSTHCLSCHGADAPTMDAFKKDQERFKKAERGPKSDTYANVMVMVNGSDTGALMRRLDDGKSKPDGKPGNMYVYLGKTEAERAENLRIVKQWIGGWTLKRKAEITEEELKAIKALEK